MPVAASETRLAASPGTDGKRIAARRAVALDFLKTHVFERDQDWGWVQRAAQCIDYGQPVSVGPHPAPPRRVAAITSAALGLGFFTEQGPSGVEYWLIAPEAPYLKWYAPYVMDDGGARPKGAGLAGDARYLVPAARAASGVRLAVREREL